MFLRVSTILMKCEEQATLYPTLVLFPSPQAPDHHPFYSFVCKQYTDTTKRVRRLFTGFKPSFDISTLPQDESSDSGYLNISNNVKRQQLDASGAPSCSPAPELLFEYHWRCATAAAATTHLLPLYSFILPTLVDVTTKRLD